MEYVWLLFSFSLVTVVTFTEGEEKGRWGEWGDYSRCSRTCGGGVQQRTRRCIRGRSHMNGMCVGSTVEYSSCNTEQCPAGSRDFREEQCSRFNNKRVNGFTRKYTWKPIIDEKNKCALKCRAEENIDIDKEFSPRVVDGTSCDDLDTFGICVAGVCQAVGCDRVIGSFVKEDKCRVCGGDGTTCHTIAAIFDDQNLGVGLHELVKIPSGATSIVVREITSSRSHLAIKNEEGKYYINGWSKTTKDNTAIPGAGTIMRYVKSPQYPDEPESITALGPTNETLYVELMLRDYNPSVQYEYSVLKSLVHEAENPRLRYTWVNGVWTRCSRQCGQGIQRRTVSCIDRQSGVAVGNDDLCDIRLKPDERRVCQEQSCPEHRKGYSWVLGHWGECSSDCGIGEQVQLAYCQEKGTMGKAIYVDDNLCTRYVGPKPEYKRACEGDISCPHWVFGEWQECSVTCGHGVQTRPVSCQEDPSNDEEEPRQRPDELCSHQQRPHNKQQCQRADCWDGSNNVNIEIKEERMKLVRCSETLYGCCKDGRTRAHNWQKSNCPDHKVTETPDRDCSKSRFGCCSDDETPADGPNGEGCPGGLIVENVCGDYGCCRDGVTLAVGPNSEGCPETRVVIQTCHNSTYGCCADGKTRASGPNGQGCPVTEGAFDTAYCGMEKDRGSCGQFVVRWYYNGTDSTCRQFWYGGCGGNRNRFDDRKTCLQSCVNVQEEEDICKLPASTGPCRASHLRYYYDYTSRTCREFTYGGCRGNQNRFRTLRDCEMKCSDSTDIDDDENVLPITNSNCYNTLYGCCHDNVTAASGPNQQGCQVHCQTSRWGCCDDGVSAAEGPNQDGCDIVSSGDEPCEETVFGCCNDGVTTALSRDKKGCLDYVPEIQPPFEETGKVLEGTENKCQLEKDYGDRCNNTIRWYHDKEDQLCKRFWYGGCGGNDNNFMTFQECKMECLMSEPLTTTTTQAPVIVTDPCQQPVETGPCRALVERYYYDPRDRRCHVFQYGGCKGNKNNFYYREDCERRCNAIRQTTISTYAPDFYTTAQTTTPRPVVPLTTQPPVVSAGEPRVVLSAAKYVRPGQELRVTCRATGGSPVTYNVMWYRNRKVLKADGLLSIKKDLMADRIGMLSEVIIEKATPEDSGTYTCRGYPHGNYKTIRIEVTEDAVVEERVINTTTAPARVSISGSQYVQSGSELRLICQASGGTPYTSNVMWYANGQILSSDDHRSIRKEVVADGRGVRSELIISRATPQDAGVYVCRSYPNSEQSAHTVQVTGVIQPERPVVNVSETVITEPAVELSGSSYVQVGSELRVTCRATGGSPVTSNVMWYHNRKMVRPDGFLRITKERMANRQGMLSEFIVEKARPEDSGTYICRGFPHGNLKSFRVQVTEDVVIEPKPEKPEVNVTEPAETDPRVVCLQPVQTGNCYASIQRWHYNHLEGQCEQFTYGGCGANSNNFETLSDCQNYCRPELICRMSAQRGNCRAYIERFFYDISAQQCRTFTYGGCGGNLNNFGTVEACNRLCMPDVKPTDNAVNGSEVCRLSRDSGTCEGYEIKWYYEESVERCTRFIYTGCGGNGNRFETQEECENRCVAQEVSTAAPITRAPVTRAPVTRAPVTRAPVTRAPVTRAPYTRAPYTRAPYTRAPVVTAAPGLDTCSLANDRGLCSNWTIVWYFNVERERCERFYYGGCGGNPNRFNTRDECEEECLSTTTQAPTTTTTAATRRPYVTYRPYTPPRRPLQGDCRFSLYGCCGDGQTPASNTLKTNCYDEPNVIERQSDGSYEIYTSNGRRVQLECELQETNPGRVLWFKDKFRVVPGPNVVDYRNGSLVIQAVSQEDNGKYSCQIGEGNDVSVVQYFNVQVRTPLRILPGLSMIAVRPAENAFLHCQAVGHPKPRVTWYQNGRPVMTRGRYNVYKNGTMIILNAKEQDMGEYECRAQNGRSEVVKRTIKLEVRETVTARIEKQGGMVNIGDEIRLSCNVGGFPVPTLTWKKDMEDLEESENVFVRGSEVVIRKATVEDSGVYRCVADNGIQKQEAVTTVQVKDEEPAEVCEDAVSAINCKLIVTGRLCGHRVFNKMCCKSCSQRRAFL